MECFQYSFRLCLWKWNWSCWLGFMSICIFYAVPNIHRYNECHGPAFDLVKKESKFTRNSGKWKPPSIRFSCFIFVPCITFLIRTQSRNVKRLHNIPDIRHLCCCCTHVPFHVLNIGYFTTNYFVVMMHFFSIKYDWFLFCFDFFSSNLSTLHVCVGMNFRFASVIMWIKKE